MTQDDSRRLEVLLREIDALMEQTRDLLIKISQRRAEAGEILKRQDARD